MNFTILSFRVTPAQFNLKNGHLKHSQAFPTPLVSSNQATERNETTRQGDAQLSLRQAWQVRSMLGA